MGGFNMVLVTFIYVWVWGQVKINPTALEERMSSIIHGFSYLPPDMCNYPGPIVFICKIWIQMDKKVFSSLFISSVSKPRQVSAGLNIITKGERRPELDHNSQQSWDLSVWAGAVGGPVYPANLSQESVQGLTYWTLWWGGCWLSGSRRDARMGPASSMATGVNRLCFSLLPVWEGSGRKQSATSCYCAGTCLIPSLWLSIMN